MKEKIYKKEIRITLIFSALLLNREPCGGFPSSISFPFCWDGSALPQSAW